MKYTITLFLAVAAVGLAFGMQAGGAEDAPKLPQIVIQMYDAAMPSGAIEIEANRDGTIIEIEAEIAVEDVPQKLRDQANKDLPGGKITGAEIESVGGKKSWEIKKVIDGKAYELVYDEAGTLVEREAEIRREDAPKVVVDTAMAVVDGAAFKSVETITKGEETVYHVKTTKDGASYKIVLKPDGTILRKVREAPAEIELPLK